MANPESTFFQELTRRRVIRTLSVYGAGAFVLLQIADVTFDPLGLPGWSMRALIVLLCVGLPITAILSWIFDITPDGVVRTSEQRSDEIDRLKTHRKVDVVIILALLVVIATLIGRDYMSPSKPTPPTTVSIDRSVAVLPFTSIGAGENNYFAEGLSAELINTLTMVPDLRVASSNSSLSLKANMSDRDIGESLQVAHLVKGSVRKAGDVIRVNVQVIRVSDGTVILTNKFENAEEDIFALQDDISSNIATSLKSTLYAQVLQKVAQARTSNVEAYDAYLLALHNRRTFGWAGVLDNAERAVELDPQFVAAHTLIANAYLRRVGGTVAPTEAYPEARRVIANALAIDRDFAPAIVVHAQLVRLAGDYVEAERLFRQAKRIAPGNSTQDLANLLQALGRSEEALNEYRLSYELDPIGTTFFASALISRELYDEARMVIDARVALSTQENRWYEYLSQAELSMRMGDFDRAGHYVNLSLQDARSGRMSQKGYIAYILSQIGRADEARTLLDEMETRATRAYVSPTGPFQACVGLKDNECAFRWLDKVVEERVFLIIIGLKTSANYDELRKDPRFDLALDRLGLLEDL